MRDEVTLGRAKVLRREMTPAEGRLWYFIRAGRFDGVKFRRQTPIGPYVADFTCRQAMPVIELDGDTHAIQVQHDARRTAYLEAQGWRVTRFANTDVMDNIEGVLLTMEAAFPSPFRR